MFSGEGEKKVIGHLSLGKKKVRKVIGHWGKGKEGKILASKRALSNTLNFTK